MIKCELFKGHSVCKVELHGEKAGRRQGDKCVAVTRVRTDGNLTIDMGRRLKRCLEGNDKHEL